jgi:cytochrome c biogenesis protein CcmG/thiol:disulfide interchange protein DsbE
VDNDTVSYVATVDNHEPDVAQLVARPRGRTVLWISSAVGVVVIGLVAVLASRTPAGSRGVPSPMIGRVAPEVAGTTIDGEPYDMGELRGRWVLVNFSATWCVPCRKEHPELIKLEQVHREAGDLSLVGVIYDDDTDAVRDFRAAEGGEWPIVADSDGRIGLGFGVTGVPETFLVAPDGTVAYRILGGVRATDIDEILRQLTR